MLSITENSEIIVVDSKEENTDLITQWFLNKGVKIKTFTNTIDAAEYISGLSSSPSAVISDMYFSKGLTGTELLDIVRTKFDQCATVVIVNKVVALDKSSLHRNHSHTYISERNIKAFLSSASEAA